MTDTGLYQQVGELKGTVEGMEKRMDDMQTDIAAVKVDVHQIRESVSRMEGTMSELSRRSSFGDNMFALLVFGFTGGALYIGKITEWTAVVLLLVAGVIWQHGSINKLANTILRKNDDARPAA